MQQNKLSRSNNQCNTPLRQITKHDLFLMQWVKTVLKISSAQSTGLPDRLDIRDYTKKRYSFIQKSPNELSLGKLLWSVFFVSLYTTPCFFWMAFLLYL